MPISWCRLPIYSGAHRIFEATNTTSNSTKLLTIQSWSTQQLIKMQAANDLNHLSLATQYAKLESPCNKIVYAPFKGRISEKLGNITQIVYICFQSGWKDESLADLCSFIVFIDLLSELSTPNPPCIASNLCFRKPISSFLNAMYRGSLRRRQRASAYTWIWDCQGFGLLCPQMQHPCVLS